MDKEICYYIVDGIMDILFEYDGYEEELQMRVKNGIFECIRYDLEEYKGERISGFDLLEPTDLIYQWLRFVEKDLEDE